MTPRRAFRERRIWRGLGNTIPIVNNYLGASFLNFVGLVPEALVNGTKVLMSGGFQDAGGIV